MKVQNFVYLKCEKIFVDKQKNPPKNIMKVTKQFSATHVNKIKREGMEKVTNSLATQGCKDM